METTKIDTSELAEGMNVLEELHAITTGLANMTKRVRALEEMKADFARIGGLMPVQIKAVLGKDDTIIDLADRTMTDDGFAVALRELGRLNREPMQLMTAQMAMAIRLKDALDALHNRYRKLKERARNQKSGPEHILAQEMAATVADTAETIERRLGIVLRHFYVTRQKVLTGVLTMSRRVAAFYPDGSPVVRAAILAAGDQRIASELEDADMRARTCRTATASAATQMRRRSSRRGAK